MRDIDYELPVTEMEMSVVHKVIPELRQLAIRALERMYCPGKKLFVFHIRRDNGKYISEGESRRYTAISLIGLLEEPDVVIARVLSGHSVNDIVKGLINGAESTNDLGEFALVLWLSRAIHHPQTFRLFKRLREMKLSDRCWPTVELSWLLMALSIESEDMTDEKTARMIARQLMLAYNERTGLFPHRADWRTAMNLRSHVACFADEVYPIMALAQYYKTTGSRESLDIICRCGEHLCSLQGKDGQWWWHYDVRTGKVLEGYPVYAVHQDAMGPMALLALQEASEMDYSLWIDQGLSWLIYPPETAGQSLIDQKADLIWRKIARHEPNRLVRGMQALVSRIHSSFRLPGMDYLFKPGLVDYESRPYHMGWILYAWPTKRVDAYHAHVSKPEEKEDLVSVDSY